jgi:hypothetical protein
MSDDGTRGEDVAADPESREPPPPLLPPPPPSATDAPPPPPTSWQQPTGQAWTQVAPPAASFDIGRVVGRTFDTMGREWSLYLALAVPAGLGAIASTLFTQSFQAVLQDPQAAAAADPAPLLALQLVIAVMSGVTALATVVATDRLWRGQAAGLGDSLAAGIRLLPRAIGLMLLALLIALALGVVFGIAILALANAAGLLVILIVLFLALAVWIGLRLAVVLPVLALESTPVLGVLGRAWRLTRGRVLSLLVATIAIGIATLVPAWGGSLFSLFVDDRLVAAVAVGLSTIVTAPLSGIWVTLAWGELTGAPHADSAVMTTGRGRVLAVTLIVGVGMVLLVVGGALAAAGSEEFLRLYEAR